MCAYVNSTGKLIYIQPRPPPPSEESINKILQHLNMKNEADRRQIFKKWPMAFIDKNH